MKGLTAIRSTAFGDLLYPALVTATLKRSIYEKLNHFFCITFTNKTGRNAKYIGIIMFPRKFGKFLPPTDRGTYPFVFVGRDGNTIGAATKKYSKRSFATFNSIS